MNPLTLTNAFFSPLFLDGTVAAAFSTEATLTAFVGFEAALAEALGDAGLADPAQAAAAAAAIRGFRPDLARLAAAIPDDGLAVPDFVAQLKAHVRASGPGGADLLPLVHAGATSQDLIDTATVLALRAVSDHLAKGLAGLVDRLLSPEPARPFEPMNIHLVLERVLRLAESDAGWATRLVRDYDPSLPEFPGDADRLTQALWNLVRNAIDAGATTVQLRTRIEHGARIFDAVHPLALRLEIVDDGRGVSPDLAEQVFLPLVSGRAEGTGLGLALAQQVAREHRGTLGFRSRPGHTVFTLLLPLESVS